MRRIALLLAGALLIAVAMPGVVAAKPTTTAVTAPVTGTVANVGTLTGTFEITRFARQGDSVVARGLLDATVTNAGAVVRTLTDVPLALPVTAASCDILTLSLGPLDLDLLGLQIHLDEVNLDITAVPGPGNLLGNLLCAVAGLLDGDGPLGQIASLLNRILMILQGL